jgi:signal transduction histidine kinase
MPALRKPPARLPRFVPHVGSGVKPGAIAGVGQGAGTFLKPTALIPSPKTTQPHPESLERLAHDARNVLSSLMLYGDLLTAPGVLTREHNHFAPELISMTRTAAQLMERILDLATSDSILPAPPSSAALPIAAPQPLPTVTVTDLAAELRHLQPLLAAIAGPSVRLSLATMPCAGRTRLAVEDLTRILVNLVRNAADAMPSGGHIRITAQYGEGHSFLDPGSTASFGPPRCVLLSVADNGPGIPAHLRDRVFGFGFTTRPGSNASPELPRRRGLGLSTVRHLVESAGGAVHLSSAPPPGACFEISMPLTHGVGKPLLPERIVTIQEVLLGMTQPRKGA